MAKKTQVLVTIVDDLDGTEVSEDDAQEVTFSYKGSSYRMDLSKKNASAFDKLINPYIAAAEKVHASRGRPKGTSSTRADSGSGRSKEELAAIRSWLNQNGHEVKGRGRVKGELLAIFDAAHESSAASNG